MMDDDHNIYPTVTIGTQVWMAKNMQIENEENGIKCYTDPADSNFKNNYGCLYSYDDALEVCPTGWHLPVYKDLAELSNYLYNAGYETVCDDNGYCIDQKAYALIEDNELWTYAVTNSVTPTGFNALPAGWGYINNDGSPTLNSRNAYAYFWSATYIAAGYDNIYNISIAIDETFNSFTIPSLKFGNSSYSGSLLTVRYIKDYSCGAHSEQWDDKAGCPCTGNWDGAYCNKCAWGYTGADCNTPENP